MSFGEISKSSGDIYKYITNRYLKTYMGAPPSNHDINEAALSLGFSVSGKPNDRKEGKNAMVSMVDQTGLVKRLSLSYYGNEIGVWFKAEAIIAHSISLGLLRSSKLTAEHICETATMILSVLKNEYVDQEGFSTQSVTTILDGMVKQGWYTKTETGEYNLAKDTSRHLFLKGLLQAQLDSYLIVANAINVLMMTGLVIEQAKLVNELHITTQEIFYQGGVKFMNSCIMEVLNTAFGRFAELGLCQARSYDSLQRGQVIYLKSPQTSKEKQEGYLNLLTDLSSEGSKGLKVIEEELSHMHKRLQGPMARL